jgi:hypothetical protein
VPTTDRSPSADRSSSKKGYPNLFFKEFYMRKKRGQNQGSMYQRSSDKRWVGQVTIQKKHYMKYFSSQPEEEAWLTRALLRISQRMPLAGTRVSLAAYFTS